MARDSERGSGASRRSTFAISTIQIVQLRTIAQPLMGEGRGPERERYDAVACRAVIGRPCDHLIGGQTGLLQKPGKPELWGDLRPPVIASNRASALATS